MGMRGAGLPTLGALLLACAAPSRSQALYSGSEMRTRETYIYGRFEARMRAAPGSGLVSAFFTYSDLSYPQWNEIDVEILGRYRNEVQLNHIIGQAGSEQHHVVRDTLAFNPHADFHAYAFSWYPDSVVWQVDGVRVHKSAQGVKGILNKPQQIMLTLWASSADSWVGPFSASILPAYAFCDWVSFAAYTPKAGPGGSDFTPRWRDDFNGWDDARWLKSTHTYPRNLAQFHPGNVIVKGGQAILGLTEKGREGFTGIVPDGLRGRGLGAGAPRGHSDRAAPPGLIAGTGTWALRWFLIDGKAL